MSGPELAAIVRSTAIHPFQAHTEVSGDPARHRADIDGLRAIAVLSVVLFHAGMGALGGGYVGVDVFFVISGFLITGIIKRDLEAGRFSIVAFYERRIRRIYPALFATLAVVTAAAYWLLVPERLMDFGRSLVAATLFVSNVFFSKGDAYFDGPSDLKPLLHTWSLGVEEQFYIFFPLYLWLCFRFFPRRVVLITAVVAVASAARSVWATSHDPKAAFFVAPTRAVELLLGALVALGVFRPVRGRLAAEVLAMIGIGMVGWSVIAYAADTPFPGARALIPCLGAAAVIHAGARRSSWVGRALGARPMVFVGLISYSLYLWHWPIFVFVKYRLIRDLTLFERVATLAVALVVSVASWRFVEQPFRTRNAVVGRRALFALAAAGMAAFAVVGIGFVRGKGAPGRFDISLRPTLAKLTYRNGPNCAAPRPALGLDPSACIIGDAAEDSVRFAVWGDSQARAFFPAIAQAAAEHHRAGIFSGTPGCPPILGVRKIERGIPEAGNDACTTSNARTFRSIVATKSITDVILVARWPYYLSGNGYGVDRFHWTAIFDVGGVGPRLTEAEIVERAVSTVRALLGTGKTVHVVQTVPELSYDVPNTLGRVLMFGRDRVLLDEPEPAVEARGHEFDRLVARFADEPRFHVVRTHDLFCSAGICRGYVDDRPLYFDNNHISELANPMVSRRLAAIPAEGGIDWGR